MIYYDKNNDLDQDYDSLFEDTQVIQKFKKRKQIFSEKKCYECGKQLKRKNQEVCDSCSRKNKYCY